MAEKQIQSPEEAREALISFITSNFYRFINNPDSADQRSLLMLVAAISLVSASDSSQAQNAAKRLAQAALAKTSKSKTNK